MLQRFLPVNLLKVVRKILFERMLKINTIKSEIRFKILRFFAFIYEI